jgi:dTDP-4-dehydrorhamnose 3,5-epimerase
VDLRPDSPTYLQHLGVELSSSNRLAIYIPEGFAHGFQTLQDHTEVFYQMSEFYAPEHASGLRYNDATLGITWPLEVTLISERDRSWPLLS